MVDPFGLSLINHLVDFIDFDTSLIEDFPTDAPGLICDDLNEPDDTENSILNYSDDDSMAFDSDGDHDSDIYSDSGESISTTNSSENDRFERAALPAGFFTSFDDEDLALDCGVSIYSIPKSF